MNKTGITLLELTLASTIFVLAVSGFYATMANVRQPSTDKTVALSAATVGARILDDLRAHVDARDYDTGNLTIGRHPLITASPNTLSISYNGVTYTYFYTVTCATGVAPPPPCTAARRIDLTINH